MSGRYHGQPMAAHQLLPINTAHFDRWLELSTEVAREVCPPTAAAHFTERAYRIPDVENYDHGRRGNRHTSR